MTTRHRVLGVDYFAGDLHAATQSIVDRATSCDAGYAVLCNTHVLTEAQRRSQLRQALAAAWVVFPDGAPIAWLQRRTGAVGAQRIAGPDLMPAVMARGRAAGIRHFLFGSTPTVLAQLRSRLDQAHPGVKIVGAFAPNPGEENEPAALEAIRTTQPHLVWVALGAPRQELWMHRHTQALDSTVMLGVGAAFDFHAGTKSRAPQLLQAAGLEWLHRLVSEPRRLGPRYLKANTAFLLLAGRELSGSITRRSQRRGGAGE